MKLLEVEWALAPVPCSWQRHCGSILKKLITLTYYPVHVTPMTFQGHVVKGQGHGDGDGNHVNSTAREPLKEFGPKTYRILTAVAKQYDYDFKVMRSKVTVIFFKLVRLVMLHLATAFASDHA